MFFNYNFYHLKSYNIDAMIEKSIFFSNIYIDSLVGKLRNKLNLFKNRLMYCLIAYLFFYYFNILKKIVSNVQNVLRFYNCIYDI